MASQTLYTGTSYPIVAQAIGATAVTVSDQTGSTMPCTLNSSNGLVICTYAPSIVGLNTLTLTAGGSSVSRQFNLAKPHGIYPQGDKMMAGAYDGYDNSSGSVFTNYVGDSFNFSQEYCSTCLASNETSFADAAHAAGLAGAAGYLWNNNCFTPFGSGNGGVAGCESEIVGMVPDSNIIFWSLPEENYFSNYSASDATLYSFIHSNDTSHRPVFKYWLSGMPYDSIQPSVANVDIIGEGEYPMDDGCSWQGSPYPNVFARWVIEQEIKAIQSAGYAIGPNYSSGQKTPILIPETVTARTYCNTAGTSGADISNQLWNGLAAGARGYFDYLWQEAVVAGNMTDTAAAMATVNNLLVGQEGIGEWMLKGTRQNDLTASVLIGPSGNVGASGTRTFSYPPIRAAVWDWAGTRVIVAINSSTSAITAAISGLPAGVPDATAVNEGRSVSITGGAFSDYFSGLGVHIYKIPLVSQQSGGRWIVLP